MTQYARFPSQSVTTSIAGPVTVVQPVGSLLHVDVDNFPNSGFSIISPGYPTQISVGTVSTQLFPANALRVYAHIFNNSAQLIFIQYGVSAAPNQGIRINPGSFFTINGDNLWLGIINAIGIISGQLIDVLEGE